MRNSCFFRWKHISFVELVTVNENKYLYLLNSSYLLNVASWTPKFKLSPV